MSFRKLSFSLLAVVAATITVFAAEEVKLDGIKCVMNPKGAAKADKTVDYKGGKVYFCCENCPKAFDAEKNAVAANHQLVATKQARQEKCPLSGQPIDTEHSLTISGATVSFCCPNCKGDVAKSEGEDQLKKVFSNAAFDKAFKVGKAK
jgi:YHS domain-containing protein